MLVSDLPTTISTITRTQYVSQNAHLGWVDQAPLEHTTTCIILPFPHPSNPTESITHEGTTPTSTQCSAPIRRRPSSHRSPAWVAAALVNTQDEWAQQLLPLNL